jgi:hypothetical protein
MYERNGGKRKIWREVKDMTGNERYGGKLITATGRMTRNP